MSRSESNNLLLPYNVHMDTHSIRTLSQQTILVCTYLRLDLAYICIED